MQHQQKQKRQKIMQQMAFDYLRLLTDYELLTQMNEKEESNQTNHSINN